ncbi:hypothetical protein HID58_032825, partial [Brassica napus]
YALSIGFHDIKERGAFRDTCRLAVGSPSSLCCLKKTRRPYDLSSASSANFTLYILLFSSFSSLPKLQKSKNLSKLLQSKLRDYLTNNGRKVDSVQEKAENFVKERDEIASDSLSDENPRQVFKNCVGSKVHSADQMIIWMTQHRALKLHMYSLHLSLLSGLMAIMILFLFNSKGRGLVSMLMWIMNCPSLLLTLLGRPSLFSSCYERSTSLPSIKPSPSPVLLLSGAQHGPDDRIPVQNPIASKVSDGTSRTVVEQTDGVAATLVKIQMSTIKLPHLLYQKEGVQHLTIRLLAQRMERRHGWIRSN